MATTEKMLPKGMMPGKDEFEKYKELYLGDPSFSLVDRIEGFDSTTLKKEYIEAFCKRYSGYTGVGDEAYDEPVARRSSMMMFSHQNDVEEMQRRESKFRQDPSEKTYKNLRSAFSTAAGTKVCRDYLAGLAAQMTPEEHRAEEERYVANQEAWNKKYERIKKIREIASSDPDFMEDLDYYGLDNEEDLAIIDELMDEEPEYIPYGHVREYSSARREYVSIPIKAVKIKALRKQIKKNQRDFAKLIGYPNVNKYALLEMGELEKIGLSLYDAFPDSLIKDICDATDANPYWLEDNSEESIYNVDEEKTAKTTKEAMDDFNMYAMFTTSKVIREWWMEKKK